MEQKNNLFKNKAMQWGLFIALASIFTTSVFYATDNTFSKAGTWVTLAVYVLGIILATLSYKNSIAPEKPFTYGNALGFGVLTMFFSSLVIAVFTYILYQIIDPGLIDEIMLQTEENLLNSGLNEDMIEQNIAMQRKIISPAFLSISQVFSVTFYGLIISLFTSIALKKKQTNGFESAMKEINDEE
jgi:hypothetical protein